jgi:hypothetical protein
MSPGVPADVRPINVGNRAEIDLVGTGRTTVTFELPTALVSSSGQRIPLSFGETDGIWMLKGQARQNVFNPRLPLEINIPPARQGATIYLGGMAVPAQTQGAGAYTATVTVRAFAPGT